MIKGITFDLWDTVIHDDSDEPKRAREGLRSKRDERRHLVWEALNSEHPTSLDDVILAYDVSDAAFNKVWKSHYVTWTVAERLRIILKGLNRTLPEARFREVVEAHECMERMTPPDLVEGIADAIGELATRYKLCVVSDAIVSPGRELRAILRHYGIEKHFQGFAFSDELAQSKPHRAMFASAAQQLGLEIEELLHIGDRDHNDIKGSHAVGMKAILFTATRCADKDITSADAVCERARDLADAVDAVAART